MAALDGERSAEAWKERLSPLPEPLDLPTDMPRPHPFDFRGQLHAFSLPQSTAEACRRLCRQRELTPFMLFSAAFGLLLGRISGKSELMIGTPVSGRTRSELWDICGPFISTLPLRINLQPGQNAEDYLGSVKRETLWVLEHQQLPVDRVLAELGVQRQFGENPLYQVMFTYRPLDVGTLTFGGMPVDAAEAPHSTAKMDLCLEGAESGGGFSFTLEYASSLFSPETAAFYARCFVSALDALAGGGPLAELDILPAEDRLRLITEPSQTVTPFRRAKMDELFSEQARRTPDAPAVVFRGESVSYAALRRRAACLSSRLRAAGVEQGGTVGLCCRRGPDIFAGMLAILENGCAYMPFLSDFPRQRIEYMLSTAAVSAVLCSPDCIDTVSGIDGVPVIPMDGGEAEPTLRSLRGGLTYVLFTSGSTGGPRA
jgi:non-ribosomal peptide synthetase component F